jgi:hypothetical protein
MLLSGHQGVAVFAAGGAMKLNLRRITYILGMSGTAIIVLTTLAAAQVFRGPDGMSYSVLNRKISTLGKPEFSAWDTLFNWGLQVGGLLLMGFIIGLSIYVGRRAMLMVALAGVVMAGGVVLVGVCPVTQPQCHRLAAQIVFFSGATTVLLFTLILLLVDQNKLSKWLAVPSAVASAAFASFVLILYFLYEHPQRVFIQGPPGEELPYLWLPSLLEWLVFFTVIIWILTLVGYLYWQEQTQKRRCRRVSG